MDYSMQTADADINQQTQTPACLGIFLPQVEGSGWAGKNRNEKKKPSETNRLPGFMHKEQMKSSGQGAST